ncbi:MAG: hypothetical protein IJ189_13460 [Clostridia bacterium]|nr:hypothetical protein [Clostridia bacterium]
MEQNDFSRASRRHYRSWSGLRKDLLDTLAPSLQGRIDYYHTKFHQAHNAWGFARILADGKCLVNFSWTEGYDGECVFAALLQKRRKEGGEDNMWEALENRFHIIQDQGGLYFDDDFLYAASAFLQMPVRVALLSPNSILKVLAVMDHRVGKRILQKMLDDRTFDSWPDWAKPFAQLRLEAEHITSVHS